MSKSCTREEHKWIKQDSLDIELRQNRGAEVAKTAKKNLVDFAKIHENIKNQMDEMGALYNLWFIS